jgi:hypothetical protein
MESLGGDITKAVEVLQEKRQSLDSSALLEDEEQTCPQRRSVSYGLKCCIR